MKTPFGTEVDLGPGHTVLDGVPALRERGTAAPHLFSLCLLWARSPISATAELVKFSGTANPLAKKLASLNSGTVPINAYGSG